MPLIILIIITNDQSEIYVRPDICKYFKISIKLQIKLLFKF